MIVILWTITYLSSISLGNALAEEFRCAATGSDNFCTLDEVFYSQDPNATSIFPQNYTHFRIMSLSNEEISTQFQVFDRELYRKMGQPLAVEIMVVELKRVVISRKLVFARFSINEIEDLSIEEGEEEPLLTNLDLSWNKIRNVTSIGGLVNLLALDLSHNNIRKLEPKAFVNLTKLEWLTLHVRISLVSLDFQNFSLPLLQTLDISENSLTVLDTEVLLRVAPKLQRLNIHKNRLTLEMLNSIKKVLQRHNVTWQSEKKYDLDIQQECHSHETIISGICHRKSLLPRSWIKCVGLSILVVIVAALQIAVIRGVLKAMGDAEIF